MEFSVTSVTCHGNLIVCWSFSGLVILSSGRLKKAVQPYNRT